MARSLWRRGWKDWRAAERRTFWWLMLLFLVGNLIIPNSLANLTPLGFWGLPFGIGVSGSLTLIVGFVLFRRQALYGVKQDGTA